MLNEVLFLTQGDLTNVSKNRPYSPTGENGFNPNLPTPQEACEALSKLGKAITPKCKHGVWLDSECDECKNEFFKNNGEKNV